MMNFSTVHIKIIECRENFVWRYIIYNLLWIKEMSKILTDASNRPILFELICKTVYRADGRNKFMAGKYNYLTSLCCQISAKSVHGEIHLSHCVKCILLWIVARMGRDQNINGRISHQIHKCNFVPRSLRYCYVTERRRDSQEVSSSFTKKH